MKFIWRFYWILKRKVYLADMNNLPKHHGAGLNTAASVASAYGRPCVSALVFACSRQICGCIHALPVRGESHIQQHANREVATKVTRIKQKWLFIAQYKADVTP